MLAVPASYMSYEAGSAYRMQPYIRDLALWIGPHRRTPQKTVFAASSPTPTPSRAVKFVDAPYDWAVIVRSTTLRAFQLRTRFPISAVQGRLAPT